MVEGWLVVIEPTCSLTQEQCGVLKGKLSVLAVSMRGLFDDPVLLTTQGLQAFYTYDYMAQETTEHIRAYLQAIGQDGHILVTLLPAQWDRSQRDQRTYKENHLLAADNVQASRLQFQ
jgi:hypothetical protein